MTLDRTLRWVLIVGLILIVLVVGWSMLEFLSPGEMRPLPVE